MTAPEAPSDAEPAASSSAPLLRITGLVAAMGGLLSIAIALMVVFSVLGRWLADHPIEGDFELVKMATAMAVFTFLPYTQARRGNVIVDSFTTGLRPATRDRVDAFWDLVYAGMIAVFAVGLTIGTMEALASGEASMQLQLVVWPVIGTCAFLATALVATSIATAFSLLGRRP